VMTNTSRSKEDSGRFTVVEPGVPSTRDRNAPMFSSSDVFLKAIPYDDRR